MRTIALATLLLAVTVGIQLRTGAYETERGLYSDESAHFMNALLFRDYVYAGIGRNPLDFAKEYYLHYPKIAPLMWPPLFHVALGVFLLPGWPPDAAALFLLAAIAAWTAWRLYRIVLTLSGPAAAACAAGIFLLAPAVVDLTSSVMLDLVLAALALEATYWLARFASSGRLREGAVFGLFAALCCLTKGNGVALVLAPALLIVLTGRYGLLRRSGLYAAAAMVIVLAAPLLIVSYRLDAAIGDFGPVTPGVVLERTRFYARYIVEQLGIVPVIFALIGIAAAARRTENARSEPPWSQALVALTGAAFLFHVISPHMSYAGRHMTLALAPLLALTMAGVTTVGRFAAPPGRRKAVEAVLLALVAGTFLLAHPALAVRKPLGYRDAVTALQSSDRLAGRTMLIVSDEGGEGALVTEVAARRSDPAPTVIRGTKFLASDDWAGHHFKMTFQSTAALMQELEDLHVDYVLFDSSAAAARLPFWNQARDLLASHADRFALTYANVSNLEMGPTRPLALYRLLYQSPGPPKTLRVDLKYSLGVVLQR